LATSGDEKMNWAWAAGGRLGYLPWDTLLVYVSGGYTQAHFNGVAFFDGSSTLGATYSGWFLGSGYEYRFDWLPGLYWRTEYRFNSYNAKDNQIFFGGVPTGEIIHSEKFVQTVTSSLVWRFNWWR
jgi:outer membrane immunogenic protein